MPELPEVETIVRQLRGALKGRVLRRAVICDPKLKTFSPASLSGCAILDVRRVGKWAVIHLSAKSSSSPGLWLGFHLRMTGRLLWSPSGAPPLGRPPRLTIEFDRGALHFVDTRRLGDVRVSAQLADFGANGMEPLSESFTPEALAGLLGHSRQAIKVFLMRQDRVAGIGNIYASEILFASGISPLRPACSLAKGEIQRLHDEARRILSRAIENCGVTFSDFQDSRGKIGGYQRFLAVYGKVGEECPQCRRVIARLVQQQRSTYYCPHCQR